MRSRTDWVERLNFEIEPSWFYPKQRDAVFHDKQLGITEAGTKTGKTVSHVHWLVGKALTVPVPEEGLVWWIAPTYQQARIAFNLVRTRYSEVGFIAEINRSEPSVTFANGCKMEFKSADRDDNLYGFQVWAVVMDEASRMLNGADIWLAIISCTTYTTQIGGGEVRIIGNVRGRNNWAYQQARRAERGEEEWHYAEITAQDARDAGVLTDETIERARRELSEEEFEELYFNKPRDELLNPFGPDAIRDCTMAEDWLGEGPAIAYGLDIARKRDYTVCIGLNRAAEVCKFYRSRAEWEVQKYELRAFCERDPVLMDATGIGDVMLPELQLAGVDARPFLFSLQGKNNIVRRIAISLRDRMVRFPEGVISRELHAYEAQETPGGRITYNAPVNEHDDCVIGLGLAIEQWHAAFAVPWGIVTTGELQRVRASRAAIKEAEKERGDVVS